MLHTRIITAIFLILGAFGWIFHTHGLVFSGIGFIVLALTCYEFMHMYKLQVLEKTLMLFIMLLIVSFFYLPNFNLAPSIRIIVIGFWCFIVPAILVFKPQKFSKLSVCILSLIIFLPTFYVMVVLHSSLTGLEFLSIMAIAWVADTGAYFTGKALGKHKLAPLISPGKSIEGALGGIILVLIYLFILKHFTHIFYLPNNVAILKFGLILSIVSIWGDLLESWFKRAAEVKDSSNLLPGHGGFFDRIDSLIAVMPIAYAMLYGYL